VREAAKRRVDAAESLYKELKASFNHKKGENAPETEKQLMKDLKGYIRDTKDSKAVIENIKPKLTGGVHKVIDEQFKDTTRFKESEEGQIEE
jgi:DNA-binding transcriptional regulator GbsR (MarR family)